MKTSLLVTTTFLKRFVAPTILAITIISQCNADQLFTRYSTGYDWKMASDAYRHSYCDMIASSMQRVQPGITGQFLYEALSTFYDTTDANVLQQRIVEVIALTVSASSRSE